MDMEDQLWQLRQEYIAELPERLDLIEAQVVDLPNHTGGSIDMMREVHSLKGSGGMLGLAFLTRACHSLEDEMARVGGAAQEEDVDGLLAYLDLIREYVAATASGATDTEEFVRRLTQLESSAQLTVAPKRVLIVEAARAMGALLSKTAKRNGCDVAFVRSGCEAIMRLVHREHDVMVTNLELEDIDGLSLARAIRSIDQISDGLKILVVTSREFETAPEAVTAVLKKDRTLASAIVPFLS